MSSSRLTKQIIYGLFYAVLFAAFFSGVYFAFLRSPASCFDNRQNQDETGIDCGGSCAPCEFKTAASLLATQVKIFPAENQTVTLFAEVPNKNFTFGASSLHYSFQVMNAAGQAVKTVEGDAYIYPGEIKYFVEPAVTVAPRDAVSAVFVITNITWAKKEDFDTLKLTPREVQTVTDPKARVMTTSGVVVNGETVPFTQLGVGAVYYDQNGAPLGASKTVLRDVRPFEERFFQITHPLIPEAYLRGTRLFFEGTRP